MFKMQKIQHRRLIVQFEQNYGITRSFRGNGIYDRKKKWDTNRYRNCYGWSLRACQNDDIPSCANQKFMIQKSGPSSLCAARLNSFSTSSDQSMIGKDVQDGVASKDNVVNGTNVKIIHKFDSLVQSTREILAESNQNSDQPTNGPQLNVIDGMINQWNDFILSSNDIRDVISCNWNHPEVISCTRAATEWMYKLYQLWICTVRSIRNKNRSNAKQSTIINALYNSSLDIASNNPFRKMIYLYSDLVPNSGYLALGILQDWNEIHQGNIELSPSRNDYEMVLSAYTNNQYRIKSLSDGRVELPHTNNALYSEVFTDSSKSNYTDMVERIPSADIIEIHDYEKMLARNLKESGYVSQEIRDQLEQWGYSMQPTLLTYQMVIKCLANTIEYYRVNNENDFDDEHEFSISLHSERYPKEHMENFKVKAMDLLQEVETSMVKLIQLIEKTTPLQELKIGNGNLRDEDFVVIARALTDIMQAFTSVLITLNENEKTNVVQNSQKFLMMWSKLLSGYENTISVRNNPVVRRQLQALDQSLSATERWSSNKESNEPVLLNFLNQGSRWYLLLQRDNTQCDDDVNTSLIVGDITKNLHNIRVLCEAYDQTWAFPNVFHCQLAVAILRKCRNRVIDNDTNEDSIQFEMQKLMERMKSVYYLKINNPTNSIWLRTKWSNSLMKAYIDSEKPDEATKVWDQMKSANLQIWPDSTSYLYVLQALSERRSSSEEGIRSTPQTRAQKAHSIWKELLSLSLDRMQQKLARPVRPHASHYYFAMRAWARSKDRKSYIYCKEVFDRFVFDSSSNAELRRGKPLSDFYVQLIRCMGFNRMTSINRDSGTREVMKYFDMCQKDGEDLSLSLHSAVLQALARVTKNAEDASLTEEFLDRTIQKFSLPSSLEDTKDANIESVPDVHCYNSALISWAASRSKRGPMRCQAIFERLVQAYKESNNHPSLKPNNFSYIAVIDSLVKCLDGTHDIDIDIGETAVEILDQMETSYAKNEAEMPSAKVYTAAMTAIWKQRNPDAVARAEDVLARMYRAYENGNLHSKPDAHAMTILIHTWARSGEPNKACMAWNIVETMIDANQKGDLYMKPTVYTFAGVLNACAYTNTSDKSIRDETVRIALKVFNALEDKTENYGGPNEFLYTYLFRTIFRLVDDKAERAKLVGLLFQRCCQEGYVTPYIIELVQQCNYQLYKQLPRDSNSLVLIRDNWSRNVTTTKSQVKPKL